MADTSASSIGQFDLLSGHLGHLSAAQQDALLNFKANLSKASLYTPPTDLAKASHDEPTLLYVNGPNGIVLSLSHLGRCCLGHLVDSCEREDST